MHGVLHHISFLTDYGLPYSARRLEINREPVWIYLIQHWNGGS